MPSRPIESYPGQARLFKERAAEYYRLRNYTQAIADYSSLLEMQPEDANALYSRGLAYEQLGQSEHSLEDYRQALTINPQLWNNYINRGVSLGQMGNLRQAVTNLTEAIRLAPKNPRAISIVGSPIFNKENGNARWMTFPTSSNFLQGMRKPITGEGFAMSKLDVRKMPWPITGNFLRYPRMRMPGQRLSKGCDNGRKANETR